MAKLTIEFTTTPDSITTTVKHGKVKASRTMRHEGEGCWRATKVGDWYDDFDDEDLAELIDDELGMFYLDVFKVIEPSYDE